MAISETKESVRHTTDGWAATQAAFCMFTEFQQARLFALN